MTKAKSKAPRSSKQAKKKLADMMREMEKATVPSSKKSPGTCIRVYCLPY